LEVKFSYSLYNKSQFSDDLSVEITNNKDFNKFLYGLSLSVGYNTVNVCLLWIKFYFKTAEIDGGKINMKAFNMGLFFMSNTSTIIAFVECCLKNPYN
jgi:hypothetical protein